MSKAVRKETPCFADVRIAIIRELSIIPVNYQFNNSCQFTGEVHSVLRPNELISAPLDAITGGLVRYLDSDKSLRLLLGDLFRYHRAVSGEQLIRLCVVADWLRIAVEAVLADKQISEQEGAALYPLFRDVARLVSKHRPEYLEFAELRADQVCNFFDFYRSDVKPFGYKHAHTHWAGLAICCNAKQHFDDVAPVRQYETMATQLFEWIVGLDGVTLDETTHLASMTKMIEERMERARSENEWVKMIGPVGPPPPVSPASQHTLRTPSRRPAQSPRTAAAAEPQRVLPKRWLRSRRPAIAAAILLAVALVFALPATRDHLRWHCWTTTEDQAADYFSYLKDWPQGRHAQEAKQRHEERSWQDALAANTIGAFQKFLSNHPDSAHVADAKDAMEKLEWQQLAEKSTVASLQQYIQKYPDGRFTALARTKIEELQSDDRPFLAAAQQSSRPAFEKFLAEYPGHKRSEEVRAAIIDMQGRDIVDLINEKKIEVRSEGSGIESLHVSVRRLVSFPVTVRIPVGTFFVSQNPSAQNMVATAESSQTIATTEWVSLRPAVACANRPKGIPGSQDKFEIQRSPNQEELARVVPILNSAKVGFAVRQAAVWIVTDDADYGDLGVLVSGFAGFGSRMIDEQDAARAMRLCDQAGIDVRSKAIWKDRERILRALKDEDLKTWLEHKSAVSAP